jgi:hypothetical protein
MSQESQNVVAKRAEDSQRSGKAIVSRLVISSSAALALFGGSAARASGPADDPLPSGEVICDKMIAAIDSVSRGIVHVDVLTWDDNQPAPVKSTYFLVFDDEKKMLRCDRDTKSRHTKYARTPTKSLYQLLMPHADAIQVGAPDRDLSGLGDQPLEPHLLWFAGAGTFLFRGRYSPIVSRWRQEAPKATVSKDNRGRILLRWARTRDISVISPTDKRPRMKPAEIIDTLIVDPALGFAPVVTMHATRLGESTTSVINELSEIQYEKKNGHFVPVAIDIRGNGDLKIKATCRWRSVNEEIDPKVFTVEGFEPKKGTAMFDFKGPQPVFIGFTGQAAQDGRGPQRPVCR